jgi:hypothetical protein
MEEARLGAGTKATTAGDNEAIRRGNKYHAHVYKVLRLEWVLNHVCMDSPWQLIIEPWFRTAKWKLRSPDTVLLNRDAGTAIVVEVKMNWANGRDVKLLTEYLPLVKSAFGLERTFPAMIVGNVRGLKHRPILSVADIIPSALEWRPGRDVPTLLHIKKV